MEALLTIEDIIKITRRAGDDWAVTHAKRLLELVNKISAGIPYDFYVMELAVYMHDWGAFPCYSQQAVEHAIRSRQVVETEFLSCLNLSFKQKAILLETIELHDYRDRRPTQSNEALLLREADMLEFLGMIGMARDFARGPRNVETCYKRILSRRGEIQGRFTLLPAQKIAKVRLERMEIALQWLNEEGFGML